jgi:hypothetical protein
MGRTLLGMALAAAAAAGALGDTLALAARGKAAEYTIVCPEGASASQKYAAEELQKFTEQMTGVKLPIASDKGALPAKAIVLGATKFGPADAAETMKKIGTDGFRIVAKPPHLFVMGAPDRGTLYGVYELLEKFGGCRWYASWHSVIPSLERFGVPADVDETETPAFGMREPFWYDAFNGDFAARLRVTGTTARLEEKHGGHPYRFGGGLWACHTFAQLVPVKEFYGKHPEYFALRYGKRDNRSDAQLCLTNPDVLRIVTERVKERIRKDPGATFYGVSQNDNCEYCECPACKAIDDREESHAGTMVQFVNAVAEDVEKEFPGVIIETLAYQYTRKPPKALKLRHNVVPCLCTIECDFSHGLDKSPYKENVAFMKDIEGWSSQASQLYVWDYTTDFSHYVNPFPNVLALQDNVKFFQTNKVRELFEQGAYQGRHGDFAELKAWLLAKWMWNPGLPQEPLLQDFFNGYYGKAAPWVRTYFDALHSFHLDPAAHPLNVFIDVRDSAIPDEFYKRAQLLWQKAEEAVKDEPAYLYNVKMGAFSVLYARLMRMPDRSGRTVWVTDDPDSPRFRIPDEQKALAKELLARLDEAKDIRLSEGLDTHNDRIAKWRRMLEPVHGSKGTGAVIEDKELHLGNPGKWGELVKDPLAEDGSAMKLFNTHYEWCTTFQMNRVAYDEGATYKIRARLRVEKAPGEKGEAVWMGVYDSAARRGEGGRELKNDDIKTEGYEWYDVATWKPNDNEYFWIGPGRFDLKAGHSAIKGLYIDKLDISRVR